MEKKVFKVGQKVNYRIMPNYKYTVLAAHEDGTYDIADGSYELGAKDNEGGSRINNVDGSYLSEAVPSYKTFRFTQGDNTFTYKVEFVNHEEPYKYAKWIMTLLREDGTCFQIYQFAKYEQMINFLGIIMFESDKVELLDSNY